RGVAFSPDGRFVATAAGDDFSSRGEAHVWEADTGKRLFSLSGHIGRVNSVAFSSDGERIVTAGADRTVRVWDARTGQPALSLRNWDDQENPSAWFSGDGRLLIASSQGTLQPSLIKVWDARDDGKLAGPPSAIRKADQALTAEEMRRL